jgi:hypothetical protein
MPENPFLLVPVVIEPPAGFDPFCRSKRANRLEVLKAVNWFWRPGRTNAKNLRHESVSYAADLA